MPETIEEQLERLRSWCESSIPYDPLLVDRAAIRAALAIIDTLHMTADCVPVTPGLRVWFEDNAGRIRSALALRFVADGCHEILTLYGWVPLNRCYSTEEAAKAAGRGA